MFETVKSCRLRRFPLSARLPVAAALVAGLFLALTHPVHAQGRPIKATLLQNIEFGILGTATISGTATVRSDGVKVLSAGIVDLGGLFQPAEFLIQGEKFGSFSITLPASAAVTLPGGPAALLSDFESDPAISGVLDHKGQATVSIGATLHITPDLWEGTYGGPFDIIVAYQ